MKKILSILLAICIMVGMVSVLASADAAKQAYVKMPFVGGAAGTQTSVKMNEGDADKFYKTTDAGLVDDTAGANADDYNIKLSYPAGGAFTISLKNAKIITPAPGSGQNGTLTIGYNTDGTENDIIDFDCVINVEADSVLKGDWGKYDGTAGGSSHGSPTINCGNTGTLTITGPGLLDVFSNSNACIAKHNGGDTGAVIFKDANFKGVKENPQPKWGSQNVIDVFNTDVIFDNTKADMTNNHEGIINHVNPKDSTTTGKITIKNGSDIKAVTTSDGCWGHAILNAPAGVTIDNSDVLLHGVGESQYTFGKQCGTITLEGVGAKGGTKEANASAFKAGRASGYFYFIAGPDVIVEEETTPPATTKPAATKATKATKATTATTAATKPAGNAATKPAGNDGANDATTGNDAETTPVDNNTTGEKKGGLTWLYILLGVVILAGAAVVVLVIVKRNAAAAEEEEYEEDEEAEDAEDAEEAEEAEEVTEEPEATEDAE